MHAHLALVAILACACACPRSVASSSPDAGVAAVRAAAEMNIFGPVKAGAWYPDDKTKLRSMLKAFLDDTKVDIQGQRVVALISPHAGYNWSGPTAAWGMAALRHQDVARVVVLAPSHSTAFAGFSTLDADQYRTPLGFIPIDVTATKRLQGLAGHKHLADAWRQEHAVEMQLPLLQQALSKPFTLVPIIVGGHSSAAELDMLAQALKPLDDGHTVFVASSDFTHYGDNFAYRPFVDDVARRLRTDLAEPAIKAISSGDVKKFEDHLQQTGDTICGREPIRVLMRMHLDATPRLLRLTTSGEKSGDFANSVTYVSMLFTRTIDSPNPAAVDSEANRPASPTSELNETEKQTLLRIARAALKQSLTSAKSLDDLKGGLQLTPGLLLERGAFVTINRRVRDSEGRPQLRGCIGYLQAQAALHLQIAQLAVNAGLHDNRFAPMQADELEQVEFEISILSPMRAVASWHDIVVGTHGMTLQKNGRRAVFLPQVATEFGWTLEQTLTQLSQKAGLPANAWREDANFEVFTADVFAEDEGTSGAFEPPRKRRP